MKDEDKKDVLEVSEEGLDNSVPVEVDAQQNHSAFGDMVQLEVTAEELTIRSLCWHLSQANVLEGRHLVNIENDDEARDLLEKEGFKVITSEEGVHSVAAGTEANGQLSLRWQMYDRSLRLLAIRALNMKYLHQDPPVAPVMKRFFEVVQREQQRQKDLEPKH